MKRRRGALAALAALLLTWASGPAHAAGAADSLLLSNAPQSVTPIYGGPGEGQTTIAYRSCSGCARTGSFAGTPAVGDLLIAECANTNEPVDAVASTGWHFIASFASPNIRGKLFVYHYVVSGDGTSYTPCTNPGTGTDVGTVIHDVSGANAVWATAFQSPMTDSSASSQGPVTCVQGTSVSNTLALAFGNADTSGGSTMNFLTFTGITGGAVNDGGVASNSMVGGANGDFAVPGSSASVTVTANWTGGAGGSATGCDLILVNP